MSRKIDEGMRVRQLAQEASSDALAEMLAIKFFNFGGDLQTPLYKQWWKSEVHQWLLKNKLVRAEIVAGWSRRAKRPILTDLGLRVILHAAETALVATGRIVPAVYEEFEAAA